MSVEDSVAAASAALKAGRWKDARAAFEAALEDQAALAEDDIGQALLGLSDALWWLGDTYGALRYRERAYATLRRAGDTASAVIAAIKLCIDHKSSLGNHAAASGWAGRAERLVDELGGDPGPLHGMVWLVRSYVAHDVGLSLELTQRALTLARELAIPDLELNALGERGRALVEAGEVEAGMPLLDEAMAGTLGGECENLDVAVYTSCAMLDACEHASDLARAIQWCRAAEAFTRTYGCPFLHAECRLLYGGVLIGAGDWVQAEIELKAALEAAEQAYPALQARALARLAELRMRQGRLEEADTLVDEIADPLTTALPAAAVRLAHGQASATAALCERFLDNFGDEHIDAAPILGRLVQAHLAAGEVDAASAAADRLADRAAKQSDDRLAAHAALATGRVRHRQGDAEEAIQSLQQAVELFARVELPWETACARLELATTLAASRRDLAIPEAKAALSGFDGLGASTGADAAAALVRSLGATGHTRTKDIGVLSKREQQILGLLGQGLSNPEIAERLYISRKTASHHVTSVLTKLGLRNRSEAAAFAASHAETAAQSPTV